MFFSKYEIDINQLKNILTVNYKTDNEGNNIRHTVLPYLSEKTYQSFTSDYHYQQQKKTAY